MTTLKSLGAASRLSQYKTLKMLFAEWCASRGCLLPRVSLVSDMPGFGGAVVAKEDIPPGLDVVVVPLALLMNVHSARRAPFWNVCEAMGVAFASDHEVLLVHVLYERNNAASAWRPYLDMLGVPEVPLLAPAEELACIKGTSMALELSKINKSLHVLAERMRPVTIARPDLGSCGVADLRWAFAVYASRALSVLWTNGETCGSLVPLADMLNHWGGAHVEYLTHVETQQFSIRSQRGTAANEQVWLNYGCRSEEKMLLNYGFTERGTPYFVQSLCVRAALSKSDPQYDEKMNLLAASGLSLEMHVLEGGAIEGPLAVLNHLCESEFEALGVLRGELRRVLNRTHVSREKAPLSRLHGELQLYAKSQRDLAALALQKVELKLLEWVKKHQPVVLEDPLSFESRFLTGGRFAKTSGGICCIVLTGGEPFRLIIPRAELISIPDDAEEGEIVAGLPESDSLAALRTLQSDDYAGLVFASCGVEEEETGEFFLAPVPCVPAYPAPEFTADDVIWTLPAGVELGVLPGIDDVK